MPSDFTIDVPHRVVFSTGTGVFTTAEFIDHMSRLSRHPDFNPDYNQVVDCRGIALLRLTGEELRELAGQSVFSSRSRRAFVVSSELHFGLSRMFAAYREITTGQKVMVFREMGEALAWLELPGSLDPSAPGKSESEVRHL